MRQLLWMGLSLLSMAFLASCKSDAGFGTTDVPVLSAPAVESQEQVGTVALGAGCYSSAVGLCGVGIDESTCTDDGDEYVEACPSNYIASCEYEGYTLYEYPNATLTCDDILSQKETQ